MFISRFAFAGILLHGSCLSAADLEPASEVSLKGSITEPEQLSGATTHRGLLVICPDEGTAFDVLKPFDSDGFQLLRSAALPHAADDKAEIDMEGATSDGEFLYLVGSHSLTRPEMKPKKSYAKNLERQLEIDDHGNRDLLFRLSLDADGEVKEPKTISLRKLLSDNELLQRFAKVPSKENGVDIEGLAVKGKHLYVGFRGPVLRENFVPVMRLKFDSPEDYELRFVNLGGRGIRDMAAVKDGFLLIAGPMGDGTGSDQLCYWNGKDCIPGEDSPGGDLTVVGKIPTEKGIKAEGLAVLAEENDEYTLLILFDGADRGGAKKFVVKKSWD